MVTQLNTRGGAIVEEHDNAMLAGELIIFWLVHPLSNRLKMPLF
jgi:hypothetical protein